MINFNRNSTSNTQNRTNTSEDTASVKFMKVTYQLLGASMIAAAAGAFLAMPYVETIHKYRWFIFGFELFMIFFGLGMTRGKPTLNLIALFVFTFVTGVALVPLMSMVMAQGGAAVIGNAFLMTAILFGSLSIFAINSKQDFSNWGKPLFIALIIIIVGSIINMVFFNSSIFHVIISGVVLILFSMFTIYDTQNIANGAYESPVDAAISLYINFLNMFSIILQFMGIASKDD